MNQPNKVSFVWVNYIRSHSSIKVILFLLGIYIAVNICFSFLYYIFNILESCSYLDYLYFSFITSFTIGFGDLAPVTAGGKILVIIHSTLIALYFASMMSIIAVKIFYPIQPIIFSDKIIYDKNQNRFVFRLININSSPIINPEIRVSITQHSVGNVIAGKVAIKLDYIIDYLGKHDFSIHFDNSDILDILQEAQKANKHNVTTNTFDSRFRITITISGSNGIQNIATLKKYYANEIVNGKAFKAIEYTDEDQRKKGMRFTKIKDFWLQFNTIIK